MPAAASHPRPPCARPGRAPDLVLLSHDQHADNLDRAGRALLGAIPRILTTESGARRLAPEVAPAAVRGLRPGQVASVAGPGRPELKVMAVPARHHPAWLPEFISGPVIGFLLRLGGQPARRILLTGDTVLTPGHLRFVAAARPAVIICNVGAVAFPYLTGPARYTMTGAQAAQLALAAGSPEVICIHQSGWSHFREGVGATRAAFDRAGLGGALVATEPGQSIALGASTAA